MMNVSPLAGKLPPEELLVNVQRLVTCYYSLEPDPDEPSQQVSFGTSGHRGSSLHAAFNEQHILVVVQAICEYRSMQGTTGPLFLGMDTHALSEPAMATTLEVLAANGVEVMVDAEGGYTPTPAVSNAILAYNRGRSAGLADGILLTPSHNPPEDGGIKYNPPHGGPAGSRDTGWIESRANELLRTRLAGVKRIGYARALAAPTTHRYDYTGSYVEKLHEVVELGVIRDAGLKLGVDPLGGAGIRYWGRIADHYGLDLTVVNSSLDPTFRFMSVDRDGKIRMDPSSSWTMQPLLVRRGEFDVAFACDTDYDRHGIVTSASGLLNPNHYLAVAAYYLFSHREGWSQGAAVGKTVVTSRMLDRVAGKLGRRVVEVPVGFKWFVDGLQDGSLGFSGEESAGASFLDRFGRAWSTDKDGMIAALLAAEMTAVTGKDPGELYDELARELGSPVYARIDAPASAAQKQRLKELSHEDVRQKELAGEPITAVLTEAAGNKASFGGLKIETPNAWFAARPSGTEDIYKIYAESFLGAEHLACIQTEATALVDNVLDKS